MVNEDIRAFITRLELTTRKLVSGPLLGDARSKRKGSGFEFHQLRDYVQGDDIRFIDWKASTRSQKMLVRQYLEDRIRNVYIVVDVSASTEYGTGSDPRGDLMKKLAAILTFVGIHSKDAVGLILFTDEIELVIAPRTSRAHAFSLVQTLLTHKPKRRTTNFEVPLNYLARLRTKKAIVCFISDFNGTIDRKLLSIVSRHQELLLFRYLDECEVSFPSAGTLLMEDVETMAQQEIDTSAGIAELLASWHRQQKELFRSARVDCLDIMAGKPFMGDLVRFLRQRTSA